MARTLLGLILVGSMGTLAVGCGGGGGSDPGTQAPGAQPPAVEVLAPETDVVVGASHVTLELVYVDADPDSEARTDLYADRDGDLGTTTDQREIARARREADGTEQHVTWAPGDLEPGTWTLIAVTRDEVAEDVAVAPGRLVVDAPPTVEILEPAADVEVLRGGLLAVAWVDDDPDDEALTRFALDVDGELATADDRIALGSPQVDADGGAREVLLDLAGVPLGRYRLVATIEDPHNPVVTVRADGAVVVTHHAWATAGGGSPAGDEGRAVAAFPDGSSVVTGEFGGVAVFGAGEAHETELTTAGQRDVFLARYESDGRLRWAVSAGGPGDQDIGNGVAAGPDGSTYAVGWYEGGIVFGPGRPDGTAVSGAGVRTLFVARYDAGGALLWVRRAGASLLKVGRGVAARPDGSCVVTGAFAGTARFDTGAAPATTDLVADGATDVFVACWRPDGSLAWARRAGGDGTALGRAAAALPDGSVLVSGEILGTTTFGPGETGQTTLAPVGLKDAFLALYDGDGRLVRVRRDGGTSTTQGEAVAAFSDGSCVVAGRFSDETVLGYGEAFETHLTAVGATDVYLAGYAPDGTLRWARSAGGPDMDLAYAVTPLGGGACAVTGYHAGTITFGAGEAAEVSFEPTGTTNAFVARYEADGDLAWARSVGSVDAVHGNGIAAFPDDACVVAGDLAGTSLFGVGEPLEAAVSPVGGSRDAFLARYAADGSLGWVRTGGGTRDDLGGDVAALPDGGAVVVGTFSGASTLGRGEPGETTLTTAGSRDAFVARYGADGRLAWARRAGGTGADRGLATAFGPAGVVYVAGAFRDIATFGLGEPGERTVESAGGDDLFLAAYAPDGTLRWVETGGGSGADAALDLAVRPDGSVVLAATVEGSVVLGRTGPTPTPREAGTSPSLAVVAFDADGRVLWARVDGADGTVEARGVAALGDGGTVVTGLLAGSATFGAGEPLATPLVGAGPHDVFVAGYDADGRLRWARRDGGAGDDQASGIAALPGGGCVVVGQVQDEATFGAGSPTESTVRTTLGSRDAFIARYGPDGDLAWVRTAGGAGSDVALAVTTLGDGSSAVTGRFRPDADFGLGDPEATTLSGGGRGEVFVARYGPDGELRWARSAGGPYADAGDGIDAAPDGALLVTGYFAGTARFSAGTPEEAALTSSGGHDVFVVRLHPDGDL